MLFPVHHTFPFWTALKSARGALLSTSWLIVSRSASMALLYSQGCGLALTSTMIYHNPEVKEQLERFGVPVLVERSSYESHPLGRMGRASAMYQPSAWVPERVMASMASSWRKQSMAAVACR